MYLTFEQIKEITKGVVRIAEESGAYRFCRFTEAQAEVYKRAAEIDPDKMHFYTKTYATSGVRLAFRTDSRRLRFEFEILPGGSSRTYAGFDLYQDGLMTGHTNVNCSHVKSGCIDFSLLEGEKTVELCLPWSAVTLLKNVELDDGATVKAASRERKMICFGDSITQGYDAMFPSMSYACRIARLLNADEINKGIGGEIFNPPLAAEPDAIEPDLITVAYGTNDWSKCTRDELFQNAKAFYTHLSGLYPNAKIFAITPICRLSGGRTNTPFGSPCTNVDAVIGEAIQGLANVTHINGWKLTPGVKDFYADQWLHPNDLGFGVYASNLYRELIKYL
jgi:hypothetical protein